MIKSAIIKFVSVILATVFIHWGLVSLYSYLCVPSGIKGVFYTFLNMGSPVCFFINKIQYELSQNYITIWATAGVSLIAWLISKLKL